MQNNSKNKLMFLWSSPW